MPEPLQEGQFFIDATGELTRFEPADLPVAAPDPAAMIRRALDVGGIRTEKVHAAARAALDALLAERQQDKERIERLEKALRGTNALAAAILSHRGHASIEMCLEEVLANAAAIQTIVDGAALAVEEDAHGD